MLDKIFNWYEALDEPVQVLLSFVAILILFLIAARIETVF